MKGEIILHLSGGLGNQIFQYYAAHKLAHKLNYKLYINKRHLGIESQLITKRSFELDCFDLTINFEKKRNILEKVYLKVSQKKIVSINDYESIYEKGTNVKYVVINYHCVDIKIDKEYFSSLFHWNRKNLCQKLLDEGKEIEKLNDAISIFLRKDDWTTLSPNDVVSENCFENEIINSGLATKKLLLFQIGKSPVNFKNIQFYKNYIDDCNKGWSSYEKLYLMSKTNYVLTSKSSYGRIALLLSRNGKGKIIDPCPSQE